MGSAAARAIGPPAPAPDMSRAVEGGTAAGGTVRERIAFRIQSMPGESSLPPLSLRWLRRQDPRSRETAGRCSVRDLGSVGVSMELSLKIQRECVSE